MSKPVAITVMIDRRDLRRLTAWAESAGLSVEVMLLRLVGEERKRRAEAGR